MTGSWKPYRLDQLGFVGRGRSRHRPRNDPSLYGGPYPFFQTGDIKAAEMYLHDYSQTYNDSGLAQSRQWEPGTLCITIAANIAETAILTIPGCFPDSVVGFVADKEKADVRFIKYSFDYLRLRMQNVSGGTTQDNLSVDKLLTFDFLVPCVDTQRKISAILSAYDNLIENNIRRIAILDELARLLYREWFVYYRVPGHVNSVTIDSQLGPIPDGWSWKTLGDIATQTPRTVNPQSVDGETPCVGLEHLPRRSIALLDWGTADQVQSTKLLFKRDDMLFGKIRPYFHKASVAPFEGICSSDTIVISPLEPKYLGLVLTCVSSDEFVAHAAQTAQGTKMPRANWDVLVKYPLAIPPEPVLHEFDRTIRDIVALVRNLIFRTKNLRRSRDLLLPKLISSELDVADMDLDTGGVAA